MALEHALSQAVRQVDLYLRRRQNIFEFCDNPHCLLRIALRASQHSIILSNGCAVQRGQLIGELHLWNEHIRQIPAGGPSLAWARLIRRQLVESFELLAQSVCSDMRFKDVRLFYAKTRLGGAMPRPHFGQLANSFGFEIVEESICAGWRGRLTSVGECMLLWGMVCAFNPVALVNHHFIQHTFYKLWMSRETLLGRYSSGA